jgi:hypothetical protein
MRSTIYVSPETESSAPLKVHARAVHSLALVTPPVLVTSYEIAIVPLRRLLALSARDQLIRRQRFLWMSEFPHHDVCDDDTTVGSNAV